MNGYNLTETLKLLAPLLIVELILIIVCIRSLIKDEVKYMPKLAWAIIICFINPIGPLLYLIIGRKRD